MILTECSTCGGRIFACDNNVWLDSPPEPWDGLLVGWTVMRLGSLSVASNGDPDHNGNAHRLHEHQPPESVMA